MFTIIQSNDTQKLAERLTQFYKNSSDDIFEEFVVIVPAKVLEEWLKKTIAQKLGISALFTTQFWGQYQWQLIARVLEVDGAYLQSIGRKQDVLKVPETSVLSASVIRWRLFAYLADETFLEHINDNDSHALHPLLSLLMDDKGVVQMDELWQFCDSLARLYVGYLTERTDWLDAWANGKKVDVNRLIDDKDAIRQLYGDDEFLNHFKQHPLQNSNLDNLDDLDNKNQEEKPEQTPEWLRQYYQELERALAYLWGQFASVYNYRTRLEQRFWQVLDNPKHPVSTQKQTLLPKKLYLFTVQQLPQIELDFLKRLSMHTHVVLLHFNPSMMFWADIVDKNWLATQSVINPDKVYLKDYGHGLLSRLGKSSRETFAMLAEMSGGGEYEAYQIDWQDIFDETLANIAPRSLLDHLKADILMLEENQIYITHNTPKQKPSAKFIFDKDDDSLVIHSCHSLKRQLEIARLLIGKWLNEAGDTPRQLSDIAVMLPDVQKNHELIRSVFGQGAGMDGLVLPAKITGVMDESTHELWTAILGVYKLPAGRLYFDEFCEWLMNSYVYRAFGMSFEMAMRACELLVQAGFVRGLDEAHLKETLHPKDTDFRRTLGYAIDRLSLSLAMGQVGVSDVLYPVVWQNGQLETMLEKTPTMAGVTLSDEPIVQALCRIYLALVGVRGQYHQKDDLISWLTCIERQVIDGYFYEFHDTQNLKSIFDAMNAMKASVRANNSHYFEKKQPAGDIRLALKFVLDALSDAIFAQQIAAEPSGVITFGRFGSLRGISFGLVIMLGMNVSEFPRTEPINRLDLKKAGLPRRGDRVSEDDDNGAFLEAILQARDNCWIFYDGQSDDGKQQLPASVVSELLAFLKSLDWQGASFDEICQYLVKNHTPTPFHVDNFEETSKSLDELTPPPIWQSVYEAMTLGSRRVPDDTIDLPNADEIADIIDKLAKKPTLSGNIALPTIISAIKNPARAYLADKIYIADDEEKDSNEPLGLDGLSNYQVNWSMINKADEMDELFYGILLPAGVARQTVFDAKKQDFNTIIDNYKMQLNALNIKSSNMELINKAIHMVDSELTLYAQLPKDKHIWCNMQLQYFGMDKWIGCYLSHLCWQIELGLDASHIYLDNKECDIDKYSSIWYFQKDINDRPTVLILKPLSKNNAIKELYQWLNFYETIKKTPICLTPNNAKIYMDNKDKEMDDGLFVSWVQSNYGDYTPSDNCHHIYWQYILGKNNPIEALKSVLPIVDILYQGIYSNSQMIEN